MFWGKYKIRGVYFAWIKIRNISKHVLATCRCDSPEAAVMRLVLDFAVGAAGSAVMHME